MKFKCVNCGHVFEADSSTANNCPVCGSINVAVQPASNKPYLIMFCVFCALIIACLVILLLPPKDKEKGKVADKETSEVVEAEERTETISEEEPSTVEESVAAETPMRINAIKVVKSPTYKSSNGTWSFAVKAELNDAATGSPVVYEVIDAKGNMITNTTGEFSNITVKGSTIEVVAKLKHDESVQFVLNLDASTGATPSDTGATTGEPKKGLVTQADVQGWINNLNTSGVNPLIDTRGNTRVARGCRFTITGLNDEDRAKGLDHPRADKIQEKVMFDEWESFTVESIECDPKTGVLKAVTARVHYPAD